jgi:hypothetical protein
MNLSFTIPLWLIEFGCHFLAAVFYMAAGGIMSRERQPGEGPDTTPAVVFAFAIVLTTIGAQL